MSQAQPVEVLLRPAVELYSVTVSAGAAFFCVAAPWSLALSPSIGIGSAAAFAAFGTLRMRQAWRILRYRRNIRRLPRYVMTSRDVPVIQVTAYTQTLSDIEARIGNRAKAGQVIGNFNNLFMLRVRETATAELLTRQLPKVEVYSTTIVSGATDSSDIRGATDFTSNIQDRISMTSVPMVEPAHIVQLPKGQCFALMQGGQLWKIRMPLPAPDPDEAMPKDLQQLAQYMRQSYTEASQWWMNVATPGLQDGPLPADLLDDGAQSAAPEDAGT